MSRIAMTLLVLSAAACAVAQEMPANLRRQIDEHYIGAWDFTMRTDQETVRGAFFARWTPGGHCVLVRMIMTGPHGKVHESGILAWQPDAKSVVHHGFLSSGDYFRITYNEFDGNRWSGQVIGLVNGERPDDSDAWVEWHDDRIVYEDGVFHFEARRRGSVSGAAQDASQEDFEEFCKLLEGRWVGEVTWVADWPGLGKRGETATSHFDVSRVQDGHALLAQFHGGVGSATALYVYDAGAMRIRGTFVDSGGTVDRITYHKSGKSWIEVGRGSQLNGIRQQFTSTWVVGEEGKSIVIEGSGKIGGKPTDDRRDVWRRVSK